MIVVMVQAFGIIAIASPNSLAFVQVERGLR